LGNIQFVNSSWVTFGQQNGCLYSNWEEINYLKVCDESVAMGDEYGLKAADGIRKVINTEQESFYLEYPCHSPNEKRWFMMRVTVFQLKNTSFYVISHQNITERKLLEEEALSRSRMDGLTNIPNRRYFDEFLNSEWRRCERLNMPITLAIIDVDHFKLLNDTYGHQTGDECLKTIGDILKRFAKRPSDIFARYGGEEFALVFGNTTLENSLDIINKLLDTIRELEIPNEKSPTMPTVTVSIGLATMHPNRQINEKELIKTADMLLYSAKENGRNQVACKCDR
jgi:diguanylate cyclase (GGDEF)-like protein